VMAAVLLCDLWTDGSPYDTSPRKKMSCWRVEWQTQIKSATTKTKS
jgi:hypothetical protein